MSHSGAAIFWILLIGGGLLLSGVLDSSIPRRASSRVALESAMTGEHVVFMPSWISSMGLFFATFLSLAVGATWLAVISEPGFLALIIGGYGGIFALLAWWMGCQLWGSTPLLQFSHEGISARVLRGQTIAWKDIAEVCYKYSGRGAFHLAIHIVPRPGRHYKHPFFYVGMNSLKHVIPLGALRTSDLNRVREAVKTACARYTNRTCEQAIV